MKITIKKTAAIAAACILLAGISSCYYIPTGYHGTAGVSIGAKDVPVNMVSIALVVTGPDMMPIQLAFPPGAPPIDLEVPAGPARTFSLFLTTPSATLKGEATVDLAAGESREVVLTPKLGGTEILVPDAQNNRIVQISTMAGAGWIEKTYIDIGAPGGYDFEPWDVDFDDQGRIYIANIGGDGPVGGVVRVDDIDHVSETSYINVDPNGGINALAVDRVNGYVYYTPGYSTLYRKNIYSPTIETDPAVMYNLNAEPAMFNFGTTGIAVDEEGYVYLTNNSSSDVLKYAPWLPEASRVVKSNTVEWPFDVMVKNGMVIVSDPGTSSIAFFDTNLTRIDPSEYLGPAGDEFVGPKRFLSAQHLPGIYVIDEDIADRIVYMDDVSGAGWTTYGSTGNGTGEFNFFSFAAF